MRSERRLRRVILASIARLKLGDRGYTITMR
jgi:hypothetical protein